jgi:hypothetical protein
VYYSPRNGRRSYDQTLLSLRDGFVMLLYKNFIYCWIILILIHNIICIISIRYKLILINYNPKCINNNWIIIHDAYKLYVLCKFNQFYYKIDVNTLSIFVSIPTIIACDFQTSPQILFLFHRHFFNAILKFKTWII